MSSLYELIIMTLHMSLFNVIKHSLKETYRAVGGRQEINEKKSELKIAKKKTKEKNTLSKTKRLRGGFKQIQSSSSCK